MSTISADYSGYNSEGGITICGCAEKLGFDGGYMGMVKAGEGFVDYRGIVMASYWYPTLPSRCGAIGFTSDSVVYILAYEIGNRVYLISCPAKAPYSSNTFSLLTAFSDTSNVLYVTNSKLINSSTIIYAGYITQITTHPYTK